MLTAEEKTFKVALISRKLLETIKNSLLVLKSTFLENIRIDRYLLIFVVLYGALVFPTIFYGIQNAKLQDLVANDEPMITMELDGMTVYPYGNPANYLNPENVEKMKLPDYWYDFTYYGLPYYGGVYLDLAFIVFAPLKFLGYKTFATAPIILRTISCAFGLLSLLVLYNFGKRYFGVLPAIIAATLLFIDSGFIYYTTIIHPDTILFFLAFFSLSLAMKHVEQGNLSTLVVLGGMIGLAQGTKMAGLWFIPMVFISIYFALQKERGNLFSKWSNLDVFLRQSFIVGIAAILFFAVSTPYAFLDSYYLDQVIKIYKMSKEPSQIYSAPIGFNDWIKSFVITYGNYVSLLLLIGTIWAILKCIAKFSQAKPIICSLALSISCFLCYTALGHYWVVIPYLVPAVAIAGLFIGLLLKDIHGFFSNKLGFIGQCIGISCVLLVFWVMLISNQQWTGPKNRLQTRMGLTSTPAVAMGNWAEKNISHNSMILYDGNAYFDPDIFPKQFMGSAVLRYRQLLQHKPDYIEIADWRVTNNWIAQKMRSTHQDGKCSPDEYSARLYQDLIENNKNLNKLGPSPVPYIDLVHYEGTGFVFYLFKIDPKFYQTQKIC